MARSDARFDLLGYEVMKHQDIGLLDQLRTAHSSGAEQDVGGNRGVRHLVDQQRLQRPVSGELLVEPALGVPPVEQVGGDLAPARGVRHEAVLVGEVGTAAQIPAGHHVGEGVVVDVLVVFVGTDHAADVPPSIRFHRHPAGPVAGGFEQEIDTRAVEERRIAGPRDVLGRRPGHVGDDVLLERPVRIWITSPSLPVT